MDVVNSFNGTSTGSITQVGHIGALDFGTTRRTETDPDHATPGGDDTKALTGIQADQIALLLDHLARQVPAVANDARRWAEELRDR